MNKLAVHLIALAILRVIWPSLGGLVWLAGNEPTA